MDVPTLSLLLQYGILQKMVTFMGILHCAGVPKWRKIPKQYFQKMLIFWKTNYKRLTLFISCSGYFFSSGYEIGELRRKEELSGGGGHNVKFSSIPYASTKKCNAKMSSSKMFWLKNVLKPLTTVWGGGGSTCPKMS